MLASLPSIEQEGYDEVYICLIGEKALNEEVG